MPTSIRLARLSGVALLVFLGLSRPAAGQSGGATFTAELETRAMLQEELSKAEANNRKSEAWLLKQRLEKGDFQDGDRIVVKLLGNTPLIGWTGDTITVRAGRMLPLPQLADLPLTGVLRSELNDRLSSHLGKYMRDSSVRATPLLRLAVLGQVRNPNYFYTAADVLLSDLIMKAGGPAPTADMDKLVIRRGTEIIWNEKDTRTALNDGISLDRLHLRAGDELYVDDVKGKTDWKQVSVYVVPVISLLITLQRVFR
jgi:protein involved in polysaccharide export with SLBB domain